jgi:hypothetical protein
VTIGTRFSTAHETIIVIVTGTDSFLTGGSGAQIPTRYYNAIFIQQQDIVPLTKLRGIVDR